MYIRTKNEIIEVNPTLTDEQIDISQGKNTPRANTIEELCDAFIIIDEDKKRSVYLKELNWTFDMIQDLGMWSDRTCYGAIWVIDSNGAPTLKSMAKMNDKGKLELL